MASNSSSARNWVRSCGISACSSWYANNIPTQFWACWVQMQATQHVTIWLHKWQEYQRHRQPLNSCYITTKLQWHSLCIIAGPSAGGWTRSSTGPAQMLTIHRSVTQVWCPSTSPPSSHLAPMYAYEELQCSRLLSPTVHTSSEGHAMSIMKFQAGLKIIKLM